MTNPVNPSIDLSESVNNGGRSLTAVWECRNLNTNQTIIMSFLGSQLNFQRAFTRPRWCAISTLTRVTKLSRTTVLKELKALEDRGYIVRTQRFDGKRKLPTQYAITGKIFDEYRVLLTAKLGNEVGGTPADGGGGVG